MDNGIFAQSWKHSIVFSFAGAQLVTLIIYGTVVKARGKALAERRPIPFPLNIMGWRPRWYFGVFCLCLSLFPTLWVALEQKVGYVPLVISKREMLSEVVFRTTHQEFVMSSYVVRMAEVLTLLRSGRSQHSTQHQLD